MFFRVKKSGQRAYLQIVENHRIAGAVRQAVIANLGRDEALIASGALAALLASGAKLTEQVLLLQALVRMTAAWRSAPSGSAARCCSRGCGTSSVSARCWTACWRRASSVLPSSVPC